MALSFDGVNDYVLVSDSPSLDLSSVFSFEAWVNLDVIPGTGIYAVFIRKNLAYLFRVVGVSGRQEVVFWEGGALRFLNSTSTTGLAVGSWSHCVATYDGSIMRFYLNGAADGTASGAFAVDTNTAALYIASQTGTAQFLDGRLDEVRIYNRVLSATEVLQRFNGREIDRTGLVLEMKLNEKRGSTTFDLSGNANNGTVSGATWKVGRREGPI